MPGLHEAETRQIATVFTMHCSFPDTQAIYHLLADVNLCNCFLILNKYFTVSMSLAVVLKRDQEKWVKEFLCVCVCK